MHLLLNIFCREKNQNPQKLTYSN